MHEKTNNRSGAQAVAAPAHPLRSLTAEQFMALGGNAVVYVRTVSGAEVARLLKTPDFADAEVLHMVVSGDGSPLMVADTEDAVADWLADRNLGIVALH